MTDVIPGAAEDPADDPAQTGRQMRAIAAALTAAGLTTHLHDTSGVLDVTATLHRPGRKKTAVIIDDDGYVEIRYWNPAGATADQVTAVIVRALAAISAAQRT
jgi:predicted transcriptional regulator